MKLALRLTLALCVFIVFASSASAQSFYLDTASARSQGLGGIYVSSSDDAIDALAANPAGLAALSAPTVNLSLSLVLPRGSFSNSVNSSAQMSRTPGVLPYGAFGMPIRHSRLSFGIGFAPDLASVSSWNYADAPGVAGASYGMQKQYSAILAGRAMAGLGIAVNPKLSLGVSLGADYNSNTLDAPYIFQQQPVLAGLKTLLDLHTTGYGWNGSIGALVRPTPNVEVGLAWKSTTTIVSNGTASGDANAQFAALGLNGVPSSFNYSAQVRNVLPQSLLADVAWRLNPRWLFAFQTDWIHWSGAFTTLPVSLSNGTNAAINGLLNSSSLVDGVPLNWKDQYSFHFGGERLLTERASLRFGYAHANNPVPSSTLNPLTAAIMSNQLSTGLVYRPGRSSFELAYSYDPTAQAQVQQSALLSGEYDNSTVRIGTQAISMNYSYRF